MKVLILNRNEMKYVLKVIFEFIANDVLWNIIKFIIIDKMKIENIVIIFQHLLLYLNNFTLLTVIEKV